MFENLKETSTFTALCESLPTASQMSEGGVLLGVGMVGISGTAFVVFVPSKIRSTNSAVQGFVVMCRATTSALSISIGDHPGITHLVNLAIITRIRYFVAYQLE